MNRSHRCNTIGKWTGLFKGISCQVLTLACHPCFFARILTLNSCRIDLRNHDGRSLFQVYLGSPFFDGKFPPSPRSILILVDEVHLVFLGCRVRVNDDPPFGVGGSITNDIPFLEFQGCAQGRYFGTGISGRGRRVGGRSRRSAWRKPCLVRCAQVLGICCTSCHT